MQMGIIGTLSFFANAGAGAGEFELASILSCVLNLQTDVVEAYSPRFFPELQGWSVGASALQTYDESTGLRAAAIRALEDASINGTELDVRFVSLGGTEYTGKAYIERFSLSAVDGGRMTGDFSILGSGALTPATGE